MASSKIRLHEFLTLNRWTSCRWMIIAVAKQRWLHKLISRASQREWKLQGWHIVVNKGG